MNPSGKIINHYESFGRAIGASEGRNLKLSRATTLPAYVKLAIDSKIIIDRES
jgi:hypothetical protein